MLFAEPFDLKPNIHDPSVLGRKNCEMSQEQPVCLTFAQIDVTLYQSPILCIEFDRCNNYFTRTFVSENTLNLIPGRKEVTSQSDLPRQSFWDKLWLNLTDAVAVV
jgi:hypothetical protein